MATFHDISVEVVEKSQETRTTRVDSWKTKLEHLKTQIHILEHWQTLTHKGKSLKKQDEPYFEFFQLWNKIFIISCVIAVSLDPLFLYIPIVHEDTKCLVLNKKLKIVAFVSRSLTDCFYIVDILLQILAKRHKPSSPRNAGEAIRSDKKKSTLRHVLAKVKTSTAVAHRFLPSYVLVDILAILPVLQVVISFFSKMRRSRSSNTRKFLNSLVLLQYVPRVLRIFLLCKNHHLIPLKAGTWIKSVFNFSLYILASHVLGALWYYFSVLRVTSCWRHAYQTDVAYENTSFDCNDPPTLRNITLLDGLCPTNPPNPTLFDFGLFTKAFQSGMLGSTDFLKKFFICFWWGWRNLSSLGQNLEPSPNTWENLFAVSISMIGLLLFLYLIGNLQTYLQFGTQESEKIRRKMKTKDVEIDLWLTKKKVPKSLKPGIMQMVENRMRENKSVRMQYILQDIRLTRKYSRMAVIKKVPMLQAMDERLLKVVCEYLKPFTYQEDHLIMEQGFPVDKVFFIRQGIVRIYRLHKVKESMKIGHTKLLKRGDIYGGELLNYVSSFTFSIDSLPKSTRNVKCVNKVEVFALEAEDLEKVVNKYWWHFTKDKFPLNQCFNHVQLELLKKLAVSAIERQIRRIIEAKKELPTDNRVVDPQMATGSGSKKWQRVHKVVKEPLPSTKESNFRSLARRLCNSS